MTTPQRVVRVPVYWLIVGLVTMLASPFLSVFAAVQRADTNRHRAEQQAIAAQAAAREESRLRTCDLFTALLDTYVEEPPTTPTGKKVQATYLYFYNDVSKCQPPRSGK
jgi:hypothetical protein